jgi:adenine phosphoribosyltransferase
MLDIDLKLIRNISDFPKTGIQFKDITPLLADPNNFEKTINAYLDKCSSSKYIAGIEARGFIFAAAVAQAGKKGFIPLRKSGKLPGPVEQQNYQLEYGEAILEIHKDIYPINASVTIVDDVLATGGTAIAAIKLCQKINLNVDSVVFLMDIPGLGGRSQISQHFPDLQISVLLAE